VNATFDRERFTADCIAAHRQDGMPAVCEVLAEAVRDHRAVLSALGEPVAAAFDIFHAAPDLTIFAAHWAPNMTLRPHDHRMEALIGIYTGREDNIFWKESDGTIAASGVACLFEGDVATLREDAIHSVTNPLGRFTGGIHIYDGDFFDTTKRQWDPETRDVEWRDGHAIKAMFERENERRAALQGEKA
jgi:predicted metal-dependent enzyme (double-stranded beta helix superfamily)